MGHTGPCRAISRVWWRFLPPRQRLHLFPRPVLPAGCAQSCRALSPKSRLSALAFGISAQDGYSRGSSRTSFSRAVSPCVPSAAPRADPPLLPSLRPSTGAPSLRGAGIPRGLRLPWASPGKERAVCEGGTPPPALQGNGAFQRASQALLPFT